MYLRYNLLNSRGARLFGRAPFDFISIVRLFGFSVLILLLYISNKRWICQTGESICLSAGTACRFVALNVVARACEQAPRLALLIISHEQTENTLLALFGDVG